MPISSSWRADDVGTVVEFLDSFNRLALGEGRTTSRTPWSVVEEWESWIPYFEEGYDWSSMNTRTTALVVNCLKLRLMTQNMQCFPDQINAMKEGVYTADERVKALFVPGVEIGSPDWPWWLRGLLRNGIGPYAEDMKRSFRVNVKNEH